jgi:hypothetical protein
VRGLGLRNLLEWLAWAKSEARPGFIPVNPSVIYKHLGWVDPSALKGIPPFSSTKMGGEDATAGGGQASCGRWRLEAASGDQQEHGQVLGLSVPDLTRKHLLCSVKLLGDIWHYPSWPLSIIYPGKLYSWLFHAQV